MQDCSKLWHGNSPRLHTNTRWWRWLINRGSIQFGWHSLVSMEIRNINSIIGVKKQSSSVCMSFQCIHFGLHVGFVYIPISKIYRGRARAFWIPIMSHNLRLDILLYYVAQIVTTKDARCAPILAGSSQATDFGTHVNTYRWRVYRWRVRSKAI